MRTSTKLESFTRARRSQIGTKEFLPEMFARLSWRLANRISVFTGGKHEDVRSGNEF